MTRPTIEELKRIQAEHNLGHLHLVAMDSSGFTMAHTDAERASGEPLDECPYHETLEGLEPFPDPDYVPCWCEGGSRYCGC